MSSVPFSISSSGLFFSGMRSSTRTSKEGKHTPLEVLEEGAKNCEDCDENKQALSRSHRKHVSPSRQAADRTPLDPAQR